MKFLIVNNDQHDPRVQHVPHDPQPDINKLALITLKLIAAIANKAVK